MIASTRAGFCKSPVEARFLYRGVVGMAVTGTFVGRGRAAVQFWRHLHLGCRNDRKRGMVLHACGFRGLAANPVAGISAIAAMRAGCSASMGCSWGWALRSSPWRHRLCQPLSFRAFASAMAMRARHGVCGSPGGGRAPGDGARPLQQNAIDVGIASEARSVWRRVFRFFSAANLCLPGMSYRARRTAASEALGVPGPMTGVLIATSSRSRWSPRPGRAARRCSGGSGWRRR